MSDPRSYQRTGAYVSWEAMEQQDADYSDEEYEEIVTRWDAKVAEEEAATASLWDNE